MRHQHRRCMIYSADVQQEGLAQFKRFADSLWVDVDLYDLPFTFGRMAQKNALHQQRITGLAMNF